MFALKRCFIDDRCSCSAVRSDVYSLHRRICRARPSNVCSSLWKDRKGELMKKDGGKGCTEAWEAQTLSIILQPDLGGLPIRTEPEAKKDWFLPRLDLFSRGMLLSYLRRSSCFMRLCFSLCSPSVTLYISLKTKKNGVSARVCGHRALLTSAGAYISFSCCSRAAWSCSMASWSWARDSSWLVFSSARDSSSLVTFSLTFST